MDNNTVRILDTQILSSNWYTLKKITYERVTQDGGIEKQSREVYDRGNGATILLYNKQQNSIILTRQFRLPTSSNADEKSFLPANLGLGAGYTWVKNEDHKLSVNGEINKLLVPAPPADATEEQYKEYNRKGVVDSWISSFSNKASGYADCM